MQEIEFYTNPDVLNNWSNKSKEDKQKIIGKYIDNITIEKKNNKFEISNIEFRKNYLEDMIYNHYKFNTPCNVYMYEDEYGIPLKLNHELKTMKEAENYFKRLEKYVGDYKLNYYISEIDEKEAEKTAKKMMKGNFDLEDFLNQLNQIKKLGPLENLLKLLPGAKKMGLNNV